MASFIKRFRIACLLMVLLTALQVAPARAQSGNNITAYDLIALVNNIRTSNGLPALEVSNILMSTAQSTAEIMAANRMGWHIGDVRGRVMAAGYGGGATAWATENFAIGPMSLEDLAWMWSDADHMIPMVKPAYRHIGAGVATAADGSVYYIVHAAYTSGSGAASTQPPGSTGAEPTSPAAQWIIPVVTATPAADGAVIHEVKMGQSLWSIAIAYNTHIVDILRFNQMSPEQQVVWIGQKLNIPVTPQPTLRQAQGTALGQAQGTALGQAQGTAFGQTQGTALGQTQGTALQPAQGTASSPTKTVATSTSSVTAVPLAEPVEAITTTARSTPSSTPAAPHPTTTSRASKSPVNLLERTIGYVLGGIFTLGALLVGFGLLARRENS
ncbi:MAG: CAP domain-containing protein [Bellilinea sp.]